MLDKVLPRVIATRNNVYHTVWDTGLFEQLGKLQSGERRPRRRLEDNRASSRQSGADLPGSHHQRIVPGCDLSDHADRLAAIHECVAGHELTSMRTMRIAGRPGKEA